MTNQVGTSGVSRDELALHFDGELTGAEAHELAAQIDADPELRDELAQLGIVRGLVRETLERKAAEVPQARFEQIWDEIDRQLDRESVSAPAGGSIWSRLWAALRPARMPLAAAAAAAAVTLVVVSMTGDDGPNEASPGANNPGAVASAQEPGADPKAAPNPLPAGDRLAQAPSPQPVPSPDASDLEDQAAEDLPKPMKVEAEIHGVEFSGQTGRISKTGTVTVLYLEEEAQPKDTERSL
jgi:anti-sigma factor RsiW